MKWGPNNNIYPWSRTWDQPVSATFVIFDPVRQRIKLPKLSFSLYLYLPWKLVFQSSAPPELGDKSLGTSSPERIRFLSRVPEIMWVQLSLELVWIKLAQFSLNAKLADIHGRPESGVSGGWGYYIDIRMSERKGSILASDIFGAKYKLFFRPPWLFFLVLRLASTE